MAELDARRAGSLVELGVALQGQKKVREAASVLERADRIYSALGPVWSNRALQVKKRLSDLKTKP